MFKLVAVTNRHLVKSSLEKQLEKIFQASVRPQRLVLREKDLPEKEYLELYQQVAPLCRQYGVELLLHNFWQLALRLHAPLQVPLSLLRLAELQARKAELPLLGTSVHSLAEAQEAVALGADYLVAGHIFPTSCKPGLPPRGLDFLREICSKVDLPVYAIGGLQLGRPRQLDQVRACGAKGAFFMSDYMQY